MNVNLDAIDEFWQWFQAHSHDFDTLRDTRDPFWNVALDQLHRLDGHLWIELSRKAFPEREFIITAEGHVEVFPLVEEIIAHAPKIPGWRFISLKPPMGFEFKTTYEGIVFNPRSMWFLPLSSKSRPRDIALRIGVPNFRLDIKRQAGNAVLVILDTALGERAAALDIQFVKVGPLPDSPETHGYIELTRLPAYIEWRRRKFQEPGISAEF